MNVDISLIEPVATRAWFDAQSRTLNVETNGVASSIDFDQIRDDDFDSQSPITQIEIGNEGTVVIYCHYDGAETWLPVDMWLPGGFTP